MFAYLECALMFDGPDTDANGHDGDEDKWDEDEQPQDLRPAVLQLVTRQQLKHEQEHVHASTQHHALVVGVRLTLQPVENLECFHPPPVYHTLSRDCHVTQLILWQIG